MKSKTLEIDDEDGHGEWYTSTPKDIGNDNRPQSMLRVGKDGGYNGSRCRSDYRRHNW